MSVPTADRQTSRSTFARGACGSTSHRDLCHSLLGKLTQQHQRSPRPPGAAHVALPYRSPLRYPILDQPAQPRSRPDNEEYRRNQHQRRPKGRDPGPTVPARGVPLDGAHQTGAPRSPIDIPFCLWRQLGIDPAGRILNRPAPHLRPPPRSPSPPVLPGTGRCR